MWGVGCKEEKNHLHEHIGRGSETRKPLVGGLVSVFLEEFQDPRGISPLSRALIPGGLTLFKLAYFYKKLSATHSYTIQALYNTP